MLLHPTPCADLTDVTLADEDSNSTPADYVNTLPEAQRTQGIESII